MSSGTFSQDSVIAVKKKVKSSLYRSGETPENIAGRFLSCRCSMTILVEQDTMNENVWQMPNSYLCTREDLEKDHGHSLVLVLRKSGIPSKRIVHKEFGTMLLKDVGGIRRKRMSNFPCYDSIVQRSNQKQRT